MLDIKFIRERRELVEKGAADKKSPIDIEKILTVDEEYRSLLQEVQDLRTERNKVAKERNIERGKEIKYLLDEKEGRLKTLEEDLCILLRAIPNLPKPDVKVGKDDSENDVIRTFKEPTTFSFKAKDHLEIGEALDMIDVERAAKVSGARFTYLKNEAVYLEMALVRFAIDTLTKEGFIPVLTPNLITRDSMKGLGYMENGGEEDMYALKNDDMFLVGTAEHALVPMHKDEILLEKDLPLRYVGFGSAFRREAGSYGKDTRGILRVHEFHKIEMVSFVAAGEDDQEHEFLLGIEEKFFQALDIPYQVSKMCTGDLGFPAARKYDIEAWMPGQEQYREVTSVSTVTDFQSRRLNIKYRTREGTEYVHILNGTAFAIGRTLIAILENYQQEDGSVVVPDILQKYTGFDKILPKSK